MTTYTLEQVKKEIKEAIREQREKQSQTPIESHVDHLCGCPDCYCGTIDKMNKTSEVFCKDCGLPLGTKVFAEKIDHCPNCSGTELKERDE